HRLEKRRSVVEPAFQAGALQLSRDGAAQVLLVAAQSVVETRNVLLAIGRDQRRVGPNRQLDPLRADAGQQRLADVAPALVQVRRADVGKRADVSGLGQILVALGELQEGFKS